MISSDTFVLKIDFLIPGLIKRQKNKIEKKNNRTSDTISGAIRALSLRNEAEEKQASPILLDEDSQNRVKTLLAHAKNGSFGAEEQSFLQKKNKKFENLSKELFDTEKRYLETLRILKDISVKVENIDSEQQAVLRDVFKEIPSLYMLHNYLDNEFYRSSSLNPSFGRWIQLFTSAAVAPYFNIYKAFLSRLRTKYETLQSVYDKDKLFQKFCQSLVLTGQFPEQHIQDVSGMYIGIQSRLMRYQLLLQKIIDLLPDGIDRECCGCALKIIINVLKISEEEVTKNEMINQALLINSKLDGRRSDLDKVSLFIRSGPCLKIPRRSVGKKPLHRHLFLFSDYFIITEPETVTTGHYLVKSELTIVSMILEDPKLEDDIPVEKCIRVRAVECVVELMFADADEKISWYKSLEDTIKQERHRNHRMLSAVPKRPTSLTTDGTEETPRAAEWVKDEQATMCALCYRHFTQIRRRHHCRACGKIFCGTCSNYRAKVDHEGPVEVRVCEVDFYRLNPNIKPKTAAAMERIAQFSESGQRYAPYHCGFLMFTKKVRDTWPHKKTHTRVEYSTGLVAREKNSTPAPLASTSPVSACASESTAIINSPSLFLSTPSRQMSLDFACLYKSSSSIANNAINTSVLVPLPAARIILRPHTSRTFCVLQPDTLLAMFAAKEDVRSCDSIILLGTRLIYLVRLNAIGEEETSPGNRSPVASTPSPSPLNPPGENHTNCRNKSIRGEPSPLGTTPTEGHTDIINERIRTPRAPLVVDTPTVFMNDDKKKTENESMVLEYDDNKVAGFSTISKLFSPVSSDTLSILSSMNSFLILPSNTDKVGHYLEAPNEEVRDIWIEKIKSCIRDFDRN